MSEHDVQDVLKATFQSAEPPAAVKSRIVQGALTRANAAPSGSRRWRWALLVVPIAFVVGFFVQGADERPVTPTDKVFAAKETARELTFGSHQVTLSPQSQLRHVASRGRGFELFVDSGRSEYRVDKLHDGDKFVVQTQQGRIVVVGTQFRVEVVGGCTAVDVTEGVVVVQPKEDQNRTLRADERFTFCARPRGNKALPADAALMHQADGLLKAEDLEGAEMLYRRLLAEHPDGDWAAQAKRILARIGEMPRTPKTVGETKTSSRALGHRE